MTLAPTPIADLDLDLDTTFEEALPHIQCCKANVFFCGIEFHPELVAVPGTPLEEICADCTEIFHQSLCPSMYQATHMHCPVDGLDTRCGYTRVLIPSRLT